MSVIPIGITNTIAQDYERRGVFKELRPGQPWFVRKFSTKELYHTTDYKLAFKVLEDANEQWAVCRDRSGVGITLAYRTLGCRTLVFLRKIIDFGPAGIFYPTSSNYKNYGTCALGPVMDVFHRFGIPQAKAQAT